MQPEEPPAAAQSLQLARRDSDGWCWLLKRPCALTPRQCGLAFVVACAMSLLVALSFWVAGIGWVLPFAVLELSALAVALLWYGRHALDRELLVLQGGRLCLECEQGGHIERREWPAVWVRVESPAQGERWLELRAGAERFWVGRWATPAQRQQLAHELRWALAHAAR
ncbi:DUF2244 domain-containing protein [Tepidimonas charontis]|uniref:Integral membrane protein n=1 Tax=Tepidimonas charontis TaxID=2267262 RepID=A0A554X9E3_9BURK|nr:DUF2244 domain-containing protein [Tepidimonas charontis]TSE32465.1 hypothetical protein Tchar_02112 [Tepidimonas charontis]